MAKELVKKTKPWKTLLLFGGLPLVVFGSLAFGGIYYKKYQDLKKQPVSADQAAQAETDRILNEVGQLYDLPKDEKPSVASVKDKEQLKDQPFFAGAENGDVAVIYTQAKLAILYRPSTRKIIRVSNVTVQETKPRVAIIGAAADRTAVESSLTAVKDQLSVVGSRDAKGSHAERIVVDISGKNGDLANKLAQTVPGARVGNLPAGEDRPTDADIVIIAAPAS